MINLVEQLATMIYIKHINQKKTDLNDTYRNHIKNIKTITQQND